MQISFIFEYFEIKQDIWFQILFLFSMKQSFFQDGNLHHIYVVLKCFFLNLFCNHFLKVKFMHFSGKSLPEKIALEFLNSVTLSVMSFSFAARAKVCLFVLVNLLTVFGFVVVSCCQGCFGSFWKISSICLLSPICSYEMSSQANHLHELFHSSSPSRSEHNGVIFSRVMTIYLHEANSNISPG